MRREQHADRGFSCRERCDARRMNARVIAIHADAPAKPPIGQACNGCGVCCLAEPCPLGALVSRRLSGACAALRWDGAGRHYRCGLVSQGRSWLSALARRWIAAGRGCDSDAEVAAA
jgi:Fe-S-cluster-containing hydrogenase component 2